MLQYFIDCFSPFLWYLRGHNYFSPITSALFLRMSLQMAPSVISKTMTIFPQRELVFIHPDYD